MLSATVQNKVAGHLHPLDHSLYLMRLDTINILFRIPYIGTTIESIIFKFNISVPTTPSIHIANTSCLQARPILPEDLYLLLDRAGKGSRTKKTVHFFPVY